MDFTTGLPTMTGQVVFSSETGPAGAALVGAALSRMSSGPLEFVLQQLMSVVSSRSMEGILSSGAAAAGPAALRNPRRRKLFPTTKTLEKAIAAPASIGLSRPRAASGMPITL